MQLNDLALLNLLQLASPALPVGAYSYSDGLETLVDSGAIALQPSGHPTAGAALWAIANQNSLWQWLEQELRYGAIRLEAAVMVRAYSSVIRNDFEALGYWNAWLTAAKETAELRSQSWQMGNSLLRLLLDVSARPQATQTLSLPDLASAAGTPCNYAIAFGIAAACWQIDLTASVLGYLHSWASHLIGAGVKLIPLGQTVGQQLLFELGPDITRCTQEVLALEDEQLSNCAWGLSLASMAHETQYTRLFRS